MKPSDYRFMKVCRGEPADTVPVWIMRQAGRYMSQYKEIRGKHTFLEMCKSPELATEVTLLPIDILKVDAAILFCDILIPVEAMGVKLDFIDGTGPVLDFTIETAGDVEKLIVPDPVEKTGFVMEAIRLLRRELEGRVPLIGFSGAPFTLASYIVEGGGSKNFIKLKMLMYQAPDVYRKLMKKITKTVIDYLNAQIEAGAQVVQIFDTWAGILTPEDYRKYVFPYTQEIIGNLNREGVPVIHFANESATLLPVIRELGADVYGLDWRIHIDEGAAILGENAIVQGNMDPTALFHPVKKIEEIAADIIRRGKSAAGHIFNLGHGILPPTDVRHAQALVEAVHKHGRRTENEPR
ncbi:MAG: uroporphyrinogen decarboxylase [Deltaproteobacteria bacterium]|nr:uroporphyrinogen decarboxylase [Deltaproteobacteria bacterium]NIS76852.1 uroporphyrinogen decarboxylase [Deltaproteobacteria bacterium]